MTDSLSNNKPLSTEKNTLLVGAAQGVQMLTTFLRAKIIAVLLGATGFGLYSVIISVIMMFQQFSSVGINQAAIKELAQSHSDSSDPKVFNDLARSFLKLSRTLALFGALLMCCLSPVLSEMFFSDKQHYIYFLVSSFALFAYSVSQTYFTILQSQRRLSIYAKISLIGAGFTLISCFGLILILKEWGLVYSIVAGFGFLAICGRFYTRGCASGSQQTVIKSLHQFKPILARGFFIMLGTFCITLFTLLLNAIVSRDGLATVGYYQASVSVMTQGIMVISIVLATEFYPRISTVHEPSMLTTNINKEFRLMLSLIIPISIAIILFAPLIVDILYTASFEIVPLLIRIMAITLVFRVLWMICGFVILSRGEKYSYFLFDGFLGNLINFLCAAIGYYVGSLLGLAIGWALGNILVSFILSVVVYRRYHVKFDKKLLAMMLFAFVFCAVAFVGFLYDLSICPFIVTAALVISLYYCARCFGLIKKYI